MRRNINTESQFDIVATFFHIFLNLIAIIEYHRTTRDILVCVERSYTIVSLDIPSKVYTSWVAETLELLRILQNPT